VKEGCIPKDLKSIVVLPIYKGKGDPMECGSYRGVTCKKLYFGFVDLEKAFHMVLRQVIRWAMRLLRVEEWLIPAVMCTVCKQVQKQLQEQFMVTVIVLR